MNKQNIKLVRDFLANMPDKRKFHMGYWSLEGFLVSAEDDLEDRHGCGTIACIGGWTEMVLNTDVARDALGLTGREAQKLFYPFGIDTESWGSEWQNVKPRHAVKVLDHLLETGKIDWSVIGEYDAEEEARLDAALADASNALNNFEKVATGKHHTAFAEPGGLIGTPIEKLSRR